MSVALDATVETPFNINVTSVTITHTWNADDVAGLAFFEFSQTNLPAGLAVTWNNVPMQQIGQTVTSGISGVNNQVGAFFGIANPATGNVQVKASWTNAIAQSGYFVAWGFRGFSVSGLDCFRHFSFSASNGATSVATNVNGTLGDLIVWVGSAGTVSVSSTDIATAGGSYTSGFTDTAETNSVTGGTSTCLGTVTGTFTPSGGSSSVFIIGLAVTPSSNYDTQGFVSSEW